MGKIKNKCPSKEDQSELMKEIIFDYKEKYKKDEVRRLWYSFVFGYFGYKKWYVTEKCLGIDDIFDKTIEECSTKYYE
jgi:hypothetical protein